MPRHVWAKPAKIMYDGLEELEEEAEEEAEEPEPVRELPEVELGEGLAELERLYEAFKANKVFPQLEEEENLRLLVGLSKDLPRCPSLQTVAWAVRAMEAMQLEDDDLFGEIQDILIARADELDTQAIMSAVPSFGRLYWVDYPLLNVFVTAIRKQLNAFTTAEVASLANALNRLGGTDDSAYAGLFFEMRQRVNIPFADKFLREALNRDGQVYKERSKDTQQALDMVTESMPENSQLKDRLEKHLQWGIETRTSRLLDGARNREAMRSGLHSIEEDLKTMRPKQNMEDEGAAETPKSRKTKTRNRMLSMKDLAGS